MQISPADRASFQRVIATLRDEAERAGLHPTIAGYFADMAADTVEFKLGFRTVAPAYAPRRIA